MEKQDCTDNLDWSEQTLLVVADAAKFGVPGAKAELEKRRKVILGLDTVTPKFAIEDGE